MKKVIMAAALSLAATTVHAGDIVKTIGAERNTETEINSIYGSVAMGGLSLGATLEDTVADNMKFNATKYEIDFTQPITENVQFYVRNDFDEDMKHTDTVIGTKVTF